MVVTHICVKFFNIYKSLSSLKKFQYKTKETYVRKKSLCNDEGQIWLVGIAGAE